VYDIAVVSEGWLNDMETIRYKSKRMNGKFSGTLKDRIVCIRSIIRALVERMKDTGVVPYLRRRNDELASQLRESRKEESRLQSHLKEDNKIEKLNCKIIELRQKIESRSAINDVEKTPPQGRTREKISLRQSQ